MGGGDRSVGLAVGRDVRGCAALIGIGHMIGVVDSAGAIPGDDGVAIGIVQRTEIDLIPHEVQIGQVESERLQNIACGHDIFPDERIVKLQARRCGPDRDSNPARSPSIGFRTLLAGLSLFDEHLP
ncbi:hypothetical protein D3C81_1668920 [compost metagenome]